MDAMLDKVVTVLARPNMALVKYWGKRRLGEDCGDPKLNLPLNSSFSITLDAGHELFTKTSIVFSERFERDTFYLDGKLQDMDNPELSERFLTIEKIRELAGVKTKALIVSVNYFPTASGLASSASGLAALVFAAAKALDVKTSQEKLSEIARIGSGSACRSMFGGFVVWERGRSPDGTDSVARQAFGEDYWRDLSVMVCMTSQKKKKISSRAGMKQTVATSELYRLRPEIAERRVIEIQRAVKDKDFDAMAEIIMADTMNMHATMLDTRPPIMYLNDISKDIIYAIEGLNEEKGRKACAYTFDAGPHACIICRKDDEKDVMNRLKGIDGVERCIKARIGAGPEILQESDSLIDVDTLLPKKHKEAR